MRFTFAAAGLVRSGPRAGARVPFIIDLAYRAAGDAKTLGLYGFGAAAHIIAQVCRWQGRDVTVVTAYEGVGNVLAGTMSEAELAALERACAPTVGSCAGQFTANTMAMVSEALGMTMPNVSMIPGVYAERAHVARVVSHGFERQLFLPFGHAMRIRDTSRRWLASGHDLRSVFETGSCPDRRPSSSTPATGR